MSSSISAPLHNQNNRTIPPISCMSNITSQMRRRIWHAGSCERSCSRRSQKTVNEYRHKAVTCPNREHYHVDPFFTSDFHLLGHYSFSRLCSSHLLHTLTNGKLLASLYTRRMLKITQGKAKKTRKFATVKRMLNPNDIRLYVLHTRHSGLLSRLFQ